MNYLPIIEKWPSHEALAEDLGLEAAHIRTLKSRRALPSQYWLKAEAGAKKRGIKGVNIKILAQIAEGKNYES